MTRIGIVGNGVAAVTAVRETRKLVPEAEIHVFSDEAVGYYPRPKLIDVVGGRLTEQEVIRYHPDWYENNNVDLHISEPVIRIDPLSMALVTSSASYERFDRMLIATGSYPFVPPIKGVEKSGVCVLRTLDDALTIREWTDRTDSQIIVGAGVLGVEIAAAIRAAGGDPIVISNTNQILPAQLDEGASDMLIRRLTDMGIEVVLDFLCSEVLGDERVTGVVSTKGDRLDGGLMVVATGIRSNIELAKDAGIKCDRGILVDNHMETTARGVYAAGDCMEWNGRCGGIIPTALDTARVAARNMFDFGSATYEGTVPSNTLKVADIDLTSIGTIRPETDDHDTIVVRNEETACYYKAVLKSDIVVGAIVLGDARIARKMRGLITSRERIEDRSSLFEP